MVPSTPGSAYCLHVLECTISATIAADFEKEQIAKLFGKQLENIGERKSQRVTQTLEAKTKLQEHAKAFREQNERTHSQLDQSIEAMEDKLSDHFNAVAYDAQRLESRYIGDKGRMSTAALRCAEQRSNMVACVNKQGSGGGSTDIAACDVTLKLLDACVSRIVTGEDGTA